MSVPPAPSFPVPPSLRVVPDYPIESERLVLRPFRRGDAEAVHAYRSRPDIARYLLDGPMDKEQCAQIVGQRVGQTALSAEGDRILLAIERRADQRMIGELSLIWRSASDAQAEIGYILHPDVHGQGYATEAASALIDFAFGPGAMHRVFARCHPLNRASWAVMERLGMRREAHLREHALVKGQWDEELIYAILDREWAARRTGRN